MVAYLKQYATPRTPVTHTENVVLVTTGLEKVCVSSYTSYVLYMALNLKYTVTTSVIKNKLSLPHFYLVYLGAKQNIPRGKC